MARGCTGVWISYPPERGTGLEGFEPPTSGLEARRSILAKPQALAPHTVGALPILTIGTGRTPRTFYKKSIVGSERVIARRLDYFDRNGPDQGFMDDILHH